MTNPDLLTKLYQRISAEQVWYRNWLLSQPPGEILNHAAEYTVQKDIYKEWNKTKTYRMEDLRDVISARAANVIQAEKEKSQREER